MGTAWKSLGTSLVLWCLSLVMAFTPCLTYANSHVEPDSDSSTESESPSKEDKEKENKKPKTEDEKAQAARDDYEKAAKESGTSEALTKLVLAIAESDKSGKYKTAEGLRELQQQIELLVKTNEILKNGQKDDPELDGIREQAKELRRQLGDALANLDDKKIGELRKTPGMRDLFTGIAGDSRNQVDEISIGTQTIPPKLTFLDTIDKLGPDGPSHPGPNSWPTYPDGSPFVGPLQPEREQEPQRQTPPTSDIMSQFGDVWNGIKTTYDSLKSVYDNAAKTVTDTISDWASSLPTGDHGRTPELLPPPREGPEPNQGPSIAATTPSSSTPSESLLASPPAPTTTGFEPAIGETPITSTPSVTTGPSVTSPGPVTTFSTTPAGPFPAEVAKTNTGSIPNTTVTTGSASPAPPTEDHPRGSAPETITTGEAPATGPFVSVTGNPVPTILGSPSGTPTNTKPGPDTNTVFGRTASDPASSTRYWIDDDGITRAPASTSTGTGGLPVATPGTLTGISGIGAAGLAASAAGASIVPATSGTTISALTTIQGATPTDSIKTFNAGTISTTPPPTSPGGNAPATVGEAVANSMTTYGNFSDGSGADSDPKKPGKISAGMSGELVLSTGGGYTELGGSTERRSLQETISAFLAEGRNEGRGLKQPTSWSTEDVEINSTTSKPTPTEESKARNLASGSATPPQPKPITEDKTPVLAAADTNVYNAPKGILGDTLASALVQAAESVESKSTVRGFKKGLERFMGKGSQPGKPHTKPAKNEPVAANF